MKFNYVYNYTDHLGNIRMSYGWDDNENALKILEESNYYPFGLKHQNYNVSQRIYNKMGIGNIDLTPCATCPRSYSDKFNGKSWEEEMGLNITAMDYRQYDNALGRFSSIDLLAEASVGLTPYHFGNNNPNYWTDPSGLRPNPNMPAWLAAMWDSRGENSNTHWVNTGNGFVIQSISGEENNGGGGPSFTNLEGFSWVGSYVSYDGVFHANIGNGNYVGYIFFPSYTVNNGDSSLNILNEVVPERWVRIGAQNGGGSLFGDILTGTEKHFNGGIGTVGVAVQGYNNIPNDIKRAYAYKLSKMTGVKSGQIFQGAKGFANSAGKWAKSLGPYGTILGAGVQVYEYGTGTWDAHTIVNTSLMIGAGVATFFAAPAVLTGIAVYGVGDYFFDFGGAIDRNVGRNSGVWGQ